jgi:ABC-type transport system involved in multi-copper enzyme maturation permease subunit
MITTAAGRSSARIGVVTPLHVLRSEWTKLRSLRSTYWSLLAAAVALGGLGMLFATIQMSEWSRLALEDPRLLAMERANFSSIDAAVGGIHVAQLAIGVLGALVVSGEYATGMIRSSLLAVPHRLSLLWGKLTVFCTVTFALMLWCALTGFFGVQAIVAGEGVDHALGDPDALRVVVGSALYVTAIGALGLGLGALLRNTAAAISAFVGLLFVLPAISTLLPAALGASIHPYLPLHAGSAIAHAQIAGPDDLAPWAGFGLLCAYVAVIVGLAAWRLARDDA